MLTNITTTTTTTTPNIAFTMTCTNFHLLLFLLTSFFSMSTSSSAPVPLLALLSLQSSLSDPLHTLSNWSYASAIDFGKFTLIPPWCAWSGVTCNTDTGEITGLDLSRRNLSGTLSLTAFQLLSPTLLVLNISGNAFAGALPPSIFLLRRLATLDISHNYFNSTFPDEVSDLALLTSLDAYSNSFIGPIPRGVTEIRYLEHLNLGGSYFNGSIPEELANLKHLRYLHLAGNVLTGKIPDQLGSLPFLEHLEIGYNAYDGGVTPAFGQLSRLRYLDIAFANLSGSLPPELGGLARLESLFLFKNRLTGFIPVRFSRLKAIKVLDLSDNRLTGPIPVGLGELTNLTMLSLMSNFLSGPIPAGIGELPNLEALQLWNNSLTGPLPDNLGSNQRLVRLDVSTNSLSGPIPLGLCTGNRLARLMLFSNRFDSVIPSSLANCTSLWRLRLESNRLNGSIPTGFGPLPNLTYMDLSSNLFTGGIPLDLVTSQSLEFLNISNNPIGGMLPATVWTTPRLQVFAASKCRLEGDMPEFGSNGCKNLYKLELAGNELCGAIPTDIGNCKRLVSLKLQHNRLTGGIPLELAELPSITEIDLSWNGLTGVVPQEFANCTTLESLDVSFNRFTIAGRPMAPSGPEKSPAIMWAVAAVVALAGTMLLAFAAKWLQWKEDTVKGSGDRARPGPWRMTAFQRLNFTADDVARCVDVSDGIIGAGSSGTVYRAKMPSGEVIAVKKLWQTQLARKEGASEKKAERSGSREQNCDNTILAEVEVLGHLRHRNIVRLLGWCTNGVTTMLLYEYMPNGSLEELLHGCDHRGKCLDEQHEKEKKAATTLDWEMRYKIVIGIAQGMSYLHHDCQPVVVHRDLKPSNILLDADMEARVADFGVAKMLHGGRGGGRQTMSVVAGSCGYIAPEYAYTLQVDEKSDIYSFGVVLLEILSGRRSVDAEYGEGNNIVEWLRSKLAQGGACGAYDVLDLTGGVECKEVREEMMLVVRVVLLCTSRNPDDRPSMRDVLSMLQEAKSNRKSFVTKQADDVGRISME